MTASEDGSSFVAPEAIDVSMLRMTTAGGTGQQDSGPVYSSTSRAWVKVLRAFDCMLVQPLKTWMRLDRGTAELRDRDLRDIGINRVDIATIRAGTYKRPSSGNVERIVARPAAGNPVTQARRLNSSPTTTSCCTETTGPGSRVQPPASNDVWACFPWTANPPRPDNTLK